MQRAQFQLLNLKKKLQRILKKKLKEKQFKKLIEKN
jgi:hypothetical protein